MYAGRGNKVYKGSYMIRGNSKGSMSFGETNSSHYKGVPFKGLKLDKKVMEVLINRASNFISDHGVIAAIQGQTYQNVTEYKDDEVKFLMRVYKLLGYRAILEERVIKKDKVRRLMLRKR